MYIHDVGAHILTIEWNVVVQWLEYMLLVWFLLGNSPASEFYMPTFWNTLSVQSRAKPFHL